MAREDIVTVTSENHKEFVDDKLGVPSPPSPEEQAAQELAEIEAKQAAEKEAKEKEEADPLHDVEEDKPVPKDKRSRLNERFSELTQRRKDAEALAEQREKEAKEAQEARDKLARDLEEMRKRYEPPKPEEQEPEPVREAFQSDQDYIKALKDWTADDTLRKEEKRKAEQAEKEQAEKRAKDWSNRVEEMKKGTPDYEEVIGKSANIAVAPHVESAILNAEDGPALLYYLAKNTEVVDKLNKMEPVAAIFELGAIKSKLEPKKSEEKKETKEISKAPAPINPIKAGAAGEVGDTSKLTYDDWKAKRRAGLIK